MKFSLHSFGNPQFAICYDSTKIQLESLPYLPELPGFVKESKETPFRGFVNLFLKQKIPVSATLADTGIFL
jgi:hypothetical protein